ncbi:MAG TPA: ComEC/Rec2 family competence protein [Thermoanaerobaculia bacterium]
MIRPVLEEGAAPAARAALWVVAGIFAGAWSVCGEAESLGLLLIAAAVLAVPAAAPRRRLSARRLAFVAFWLAAGFLTGRLRLAIPATQAEDAFRRAGAGGAFSDAVEGVLDDFWSGEPPRARTTLRARRIRAAEGWIPFRAEVVVYLSGQPPATDLPDRGDRVRLTGRLEREDLPASERELPLPWPRYRLSVKSARLVEREGATLLSALTLPNRFLFRAATRAHGSDSSDAGRDEAGVRGPLAALLLGRTSELDRGLVARFRRGGLYHLLVVSGLHVLLAVGLAGFLLERFRVEGKRRDAMLLGAVALFVLVGGANPPAVRAGIVVGVFLMTRLLERPVTGAQAVGLSACALLLASPRQVFSVGTVLTFAAVLGIASFVEPIAAALPSRPRWLFSGLAASLAAQCATAPVLLWRFNLVAAAAWLTAPLAIPLSAALIALGGLVLLLDAAGLPWVAAPPAGLFASGVSILEWTADRAAGAAFLRPTPPLGGVLAVGALLVVAARTRGRLRAWSAAGAGAAFLFLALRPGPRGPAEGFSIEALDVGQGDAILLRWKDRAILVDGGGPFDAVSTDFGRTRVIPKLLDRGVTRLDAVLLTHPHPDHALGLFAVVDELPVARLLRSSGDDEGDLSTRLEAVAGSRRVPVRMLVDGDALAWPEGARLTVLHSGGRRRKTDAVNNQSVVAIFERDGRSALLTGDAGAPTEAELAAAGALTPVDVLKVGHHGSRTSTSAALLEGIRPRVALLSCGRGNRFGHPAPDTLATLARFCVPVLRTDQRSDCRIELTPRGTRLRWRGSEGP